MDRIPLDPNSVSDILRATSIVEVAVETVRTSEWSVTGRFKQRDLDMTLRVVEVFKGVQDPPPETVFPLHTVQFAPAIPRYFALPGPWSPFDPQPGDSFVLFHIGMTTIRVQPSDTAVPDLERVLLAGVPELSLGAIIGNTIAQIQDWEFLFAKYLEARLPECFFESLYDFRVYLNAMEDPRLQEGMRFVLLSAAYTKLMMYDPAPAEFIADLLSSTARILQAGLGGESLQEAVLETYLPNLLGITSGLEPKHAADLLSTIPSDQSLVEDWIVSSGDGSLLSWLQA